LAVAIALLIAASPAWAALPSAQVNAITVACQQLLADYAIYRDHLDVEGFANAFTSDATLVLATRSYVGRDELRKEITDHPSPAIAHMIHFTSTKITPVSATKATGVSYAVILNGNRHVGPGDQPIQMEGITSAGEYLSEFALTNDGWKISRMELKSVFRGPGFAK